MPNPRAWLCWSSGKDSAWALHVVRQQGEVDVVGLLSTVTEPFDRVSMHGVRREVLKAQAAAAGLPLLQVAIPEQCSNETYEAAMREAVDGARADGVTEMIFGDLFLEDVRQYRERQLSGTGIAPRFPLWGLDTHALAREMIGAGLVAYVTCLDPRKVPRELAGCRYDESLLKRFGPGVDPCAEHGEFHTCVTAGPMFSRPIDVEPGETLQRDGFVFTDLVLAGNAAG
jgi:uncharacterized protein (TIGR00290 family)